MVTRKFLSMRSPIVDAFTLIELLVVISIIALLAVIAIPTLQSTQESGKATKCLNNERQIFVGFQSYLNEHNGRLMQRLYDNRPEYGYDELLLPYVGNNTGIFVCPSQKKVNYPHQPGYGMNWYYDNQTIFSVQFPSQTILIAEAIGNGDGSHRADRDSIDPGQLDKARHSGFANYLFFDGHVARLKFSDTTVPVAATNPAVDMWGIDAGDHNQPAPQ